MHVQFLPWQFNCDEVVHVVMKLTSTQQVYLENFMFNGHINEALLVAIKLGVYNEVYVVAFSG